jgi:DNA-binding PadR family transcriptional regulator
MGARPLCPFVLSLLATQPRRAHEVARALGGAATGYQEALTTLDRLRDGGLVRRRAAAAGPLYQITRRGRAELRLQRLLWASLMSATPRARLCSSDGCEPDRRLRRRE